MRSSTEQSTKRSYCSHRRDLQPHTIDTKRSDPFEYSPVVLPELPVIEDVHIDAETWSLVINVHCDGMADEDVRAWLKVDMMDPDDPTELLDRSEIWEGLLDEVDDKHYSSPIVMEPVCVGRPFVVRVRAINAAGSRTSNISEPVMLRLAPPTPRIVNRKAFDSQCALSFECSNYKVDPKVGVHFELSQNGEVMPLIKSYKHRACKLKNGWPYTFKVRATNQFGTSEWSKSVKLTPLRKPVLSLPVLSAMFILEGNHCESFLKMHCILMFDRPLSARCLETAG